MSRLKGPSYFKSWNRISIVLIFVLIGLLINGSPIILAQTVPSIPTTDPQFKVAFIADAGLGTGTDDDPRGVLQLIKDEGAQMVLHQGDFEYADDPQAFDQQINDILGPDFPYFITVGNHDKPAWSSYRRLFEERLTRIDGAECTGALGLESACKYKGLFFISVGPGVKTSPSGSYSDFIRQELAQDDSVWNVCSWHELQERMQIGRKPDSVGWGPYEECRLGGAIVASGHSHTYSRTKTLIDTRNQIVHPDWPDPGKVLLSPGSTFVFDSSLGGKGARDQKRCFPATYPYGCKGEWASIYTSDSPAANDKDRNGALFITFNDGDPRRATAYFKNIAGEIIDSFVIISMEGPDFTPPTQPQSLSATPVSDNGIDLAWDASQDPDSGIGSYRIYRDDVFLAESSSTTFSDGGLVESTAYDYEVSAVNGVGSESERSALTSVTTLADTTPPEIIAVGASDETSVVLFFSEPVEFNSAINVANYSIDNGATVLDAAIVGDLQSIELTTSVLADGTNYTLTVANVTDDAATPNSIAQVDIQFTYLAPADARLEIFDTHFLQYGGQPVALFGMSNFWTLSDPGVDYQDMISAYKSDGSNFMRMSLFGHTVANRTGLDALDVVYPFLRSSTSGANDGGNKFDLTQLNPAYFQRLREVSQFAQQNDVFIMYVIWDEIPLEDRSGRWEINPFNPNNNINNLGLPSTEAVPEFYDLTNTGLLSIQEAFLNGVLDTTSPFGNTFFSISNEYTGGGAWHRHWVDLINAYEISNDVGPILTNELLWKFEPDYTDFISLKTTQTGGAGNWRDTRPVVNHKTGPKFERDSERDAARKAWWSVFVNGGHTGDDSHDGVDPPDQHNSAGTLLAREQIRYFRDFIETLPYNEMVPAFVVGSGLISAGEGRVNLGQEYVVYLSSGGSVTVDLSDASGILTVEWYNPRSGTYQEESPVSAGGSTTFNAPDTNDWVLHIGGRPAEGSAILINLGDEFTSSQIVTLNMSCFSESGVKDVRYGNGGAFGAYEPFSPVKTWVLPSGDGVQTVLYECRNNIDVTNSASDGIILETSPPTAPTGFSLNPVSSSQMDLSWTAASDPESGISGYSVYRDGTLIGNTSLTSFSDTGLEEGTIYTYEVSAVNGVDLETMSPPVSESTLADTAPPDIVSVIASDVTSITVIFSEPVEITSAESTSNYAIDNGVTISGAALQSDSKIVNLSTSTLSEEVAYKLTVSGVRDFAGNPIAANTIVDFSLVLGPPAYYELDGMAVVEAEHFAEIDQRSDSISWVLATANTGFAGEGYMWTVDGTASNGSWSSNAELAFAVNISTPGEYFIAARHRSPDSASNSAFVGVDGVDKTIIKEFTTVTSEWAWTHGPSLGTLDVGPHTVQIRRREDGFQLDRVMIADSLSKLPADGSTEVGPPESLTGPGSLGVENAKDLDGDGLFEDVNGNGLLDFTDVVTLFENMRSSEVQANISRFDYNGNGRIDFMDIVLLFKMISA